MKIDRGQPGQGEDISGQNEAAGYGHYKIWRQLLDPAGDLAVAAGLGLDNGQTLGLGRLLDRRGSQPPAPAGRPVGLGDDGRQVVSRLKKGLQGGHGLVGRAEIDHPSFHSSLSPSLALCCLRR